MSTVTIHRIVGAKKALDVCRIVEELYLAGRRVVVFVSDAKRAAILDDYLWTFSQPAFVPHCLWDGGAPVEEQVVLVSGELANPNGADVLVVGDRLSDLAAAGAFSDIHDVVAELVEDAGKSEAWEAAEFTVTNAPGGRAGRG